MFSASMSSRIALDTCYRAGDFSSSTKNAVPLSNLADTVEIDASANPLKKSTFIHFNYANELNEMVLSEVNEPRPFGMLQNDSLSENVEQWSHFLSAEKLLMADVCH